MLPDTEWVGQSGCRKNNQMKSVRPNHKTGEMNNTRLWKHSFSLPDEGLSAERGSRKTLCCWKATPDGINGRPIPYFLPYFLLLVCHVKPCTTKMHPVVKITFLQIQLSTIQLKNVKFLSAVKCCQFPLIYLLSYMSILDAKYIPD